VTSRSEVGGESVKRKTLLIKKHITDIARELRGNQTSSENLLWQNLRNRKLPGFKFLRQHPIIYGGNEFSPQFFVADFYCEEKKLIIELDGKYHDFQKDFDANRDSILSELGLRTLRINNEELKNMSQVLVKIRSFLTHPPSYSLLCREGVTEPESASVANEGSGQGGEKLFIGTKSISHLASPSLQSRGGVTSRSEVGGELAIILLAAGSSSRLGQSKQLLLINGEPLLLKSVNTALESGVKKVLVVLGANDFEHRQVIEKLPVEIIFNSTWQKGMGNSLKAGLSHLLKMDSKIDGVITMVSDQPLITSTHLKKLIEAFKQTKKPIVASFYSEAVGVPALFEKSLFEKILNMRDEHGAKKVINQDLDIVATVDFPEGAIDIDTEDDVKKFLS
jgi:molybdenum cofactor cytidylyltransferase